MADPEGRKRARLLKSGRTIRVTKPTLLCQRVGHSEGFCPRKNPPKAGRVGSAKAATGPLLKHETRREGPAGRTSDILIISEYNEKLEMSMVYITPNKTLLTTAVKAVVAREAAAPSAGASKIAPGVSAPGHPQTNGAGAGATRLPWPVSFQNASQRPFP